MFYATLSLLLGLVTLPSPYPARRRGGYSFWECDFLASGLMSLRALSEPSLCVSSSGPGRCSLEDGLREDPPDVPISTSTYFEVLARTCNINGSSR